MIEFNLKEYEIGKISNLLKEIPVVPTTDLDSYINDIKKSYYQN